LHYGIELVLLLAIQKMEVLFVLFDQNAGLRKYLNEKEYNTQMLLHQKLEHIFL